MANMCSNTIYFCSTNKEVLERFMDTVQDGDSYQKLFMKNGYTEKEAMEHCDGRDYITFCDYEITERDGFYYFMVDTETAWDTHIETFHLLFKQKYDNEIFAYYCSEEPGFSIFVTNDGEKMFFEDRYRISAYETVYFPNKNELVEYIKEEYGVEVSIIDSVDKMEKQVKAKMQEDNRHGYCTINKYDIDMYG